MTGSNSGNKARSRAPTNGVGVRGRTSGQRLSAQRAPGLTAELVSVVEAKLSASVVASEPIRGGGVPTRFRCELDNGSVVIIKTQTDQLLELRTTEAQSLEWLRNAGAPVPRVLASDDDEPAHLVLSWIQPGRSTREGDSSFGAMLARLHQQPFPCFGRPDSRITGSCGLPNDSVDSWHDQYGKQRLLPLAELGIERGMIPSVLARQLVTVAESLDDFAGPTEPPSLLHGDLWAGNRIVDSAGRCWMINPASFGGHREFDLATMRLFGGYGPDCFNAYHDSFPLADGWEDRVLLHQLSPLTVQAVKFGGHYVGALSNAVDTLLARVGSSN